jgi:cysteine-rich repeat protein
VSAAGLGPRGEGGYVWAQVSPAALPPRARRRPALALALLVPACLSWSELEKGACGDGFVGREEACDDGNRISGDGCSDTCRNEPAVCGDGRKDPGEDCDDANGIDTDACLEGCRDASCGDGELWELIEECDDGNQASGDGCSDGCRREMLPAGPRCGDGNVDPDEACDDGNESKADSCLVGCSFAACGDGVVRQGVEECDDAGASLTCTIGCMRCGQAATGYFRNGNGHCYTVHAEAVTEQRARSACQEEGGDLWTITSEAEGNDVWSKLELDDGRYWLGLVTANASSSSWVSGENTKYTRFGPGEPRDTSLRCVASTLDAWSSEPCSTALPYVCERWPAFIFPVDHHAYRLRTGPLAAADARQRCAQDGGRLATLETNEERLFAGKNVGVAAWLDASDSAREGTFSWATGELVEISWFAAGKPNDPDGTRGCLLLNPGDKLADADCSEPHAYVCEYD